jgi:hypothetical protein
VFLNDSARVGLELGGVSARRNHNRHATVMSSNDIKREYSKMEVETNTWAHTAMQEDDENSEMEQ